MRTFSDSQKRGRLLALRLGATAIVLLILVLPLPHVIVLRSAGFVLALLCAGFLFLKCPPAKARTLPFFWVFMVWLIVALLSLSSSPHVSVALEQIWGEVIKSALIFYSAYIIAQERQSGATWFYASTVSLSLLASMSISAWLEQGEWQVIGPIPPLGEYSTSALTLWPLTLLPVFANWSRPLGALSRPLAALSTALAISAGMLAQSRAFWLVAAVMLLCATIAWRSRIKQQTPIRRVASVLCILALLAFLAARWRGYDLLYFTDRSEIYVAVWNHLREAPMFGFGYGHESLKEWYAAHMPDTAIRHAHNIVLSYAEQMGLPGVLVVFGIFGGLSLRFFRRIRDADLYGAGLATLGLALVVGIFVKNSFDIFFVRHNLLLFFLCCGILLGSAECGGDAAPRKAEVK